MIMLVNKVYLVRDRLFGSESFACVKSISKSAWGGNSRLRVLVDYPPQFGMESFLLDYTQDSFDSQFEVVELVGDSEEFGGLFDPKRLKFGVRDL